MLLEGPFHFSGRRAVLYCPLNPLRLFWIWTSFFCCCNLTSYPSLSSYRAASYGTFLRMLFPSIYCYCYSFDFSTTTAHPALHCFAPRYILIVPPTVHCLTPHHQHALTQFLSSLRISDYFIPMVHGPFSTHTIHYKNTIRATVLCTVHYTTSHVQLNIIPDSRYQEEERL